MGRHRKRATTDNDVVSEEHVGEHKKRDVVEERLGLTGQVCCDCNSRVPKRAEKCRKCGSKQLRPKRSQYADG